MQNFLEKLNEYQKVVEQLQQDYWTHMKFTYAPVPKVELVHGNRYVKVMVVEYSFNGDRVSSHPHTFIDKTNGDILKTATYKAPQKNGVRGNIFNDYSNKINHHGAIYLK